MTAPSPKAVATPAHIATESTPNLFTREDTLLGVCQGLGEDLGVNPLWIRLGFIAPLFVFPTMTILAYLAIGVVLMTVRLAVPNRSAQASEVAPARIVSEPANDESPPALAA